MREGGGEGGGVSWNLIREFTKQILGVFLWNTWRSSNHCVDSWGGGSGLQKATLTPSNLSNDMSLKLFKNNITTKNSNPNLNSANKCYNFHIKFMFYNYHMHPGMHYALWYETKKTKHTKPPQDQKVRIVVHNLVTQIQIFHARQRQIGWRCMSPS
jgi:hypothetical protein